MDRTTARENDDAAPAERVRVVPGAIHEIIGLHAHHRPDRQAVLSPGRPPISYAQLGLQIERTVSQLNGAGIGRGDRVAMVLPNGPEMAVAFCAVASGACCAPLNPAYGREEFEFFLSDLRAAALLVPEETETAAVAVAEARHIPVLRLSCRPDDSAGTFDLKLPAGKPARTFGMAGREEIALLLHTSGTTSRPKLVPLLHRNLCESAANISKTLGLTEHDRCLNIMPLFHIHGLVGAILSTLRAGASVVCTEGFHAGRFFQWMEEFEPSWYTAVPTMHQALLARAEKVSQSLMRPLRFVRSSSASLPPKVMADLETLFRAPVVESYGMTETAHQIASNPLPPQTRKPGSVGPPAGPEIAILDESGNFLAAGEKGEVAVRGSNVSPGYEANAEANRRAFDQGWFRTGDQGYFDDDGYLFLTGRLKEIINRGGEKISPREVDEVLLEHPSIRQAVTFSIPHEPLGEEIGVAVIPKKGFDLSEREVQEYAAARLADFKVPRVVKIVDNIPRGPTGKLQRIGLAGKLGIEPITIPTQPGRAEHSGPRNAAERVLVEMWREILVLDDVGVHDDFFAMGGTSLQAMQLLERLRDNGLGTVSALDFLDVPTVAGMAERLVQGTEAERLPKGLVPLQPTGSLPPFFCAPGHDGNLLGLAGLTRHLGSDQPLIGLDPLLNEEFRRLSMESLAARLIELIQKYEPTGPYMLLGVCFGGKVLFELACQLQQQGKQVGFLGLINAFHPRPLRLAERLENVAQNFYQRSRFHRRRLSGMSAAEKLGYGKQRAQAFLEHSVRPRLCRLIGPMGNHAARSSDQRRLQSQSIIDAWNPRRYSGPTALIVDSIPRAGVYPSSQMGWEGLIPGEADLFVVPDDDFSFWTGANTEYVAEVFRRMAHAGRG